MKILNILILLLLIGCNKIENLYCLPETNRPISTTTNDGFIVRGLNQENIDNLLFIENTIDSSFAIVQTCTGLQSDNRPYITVVNNISPINQCLGVNVNSKASIKYGYGEPTEIFIQREWVYTAQLYRHELIHFLLIEHNRFSDSENHTPDFIWQCQF